MPMILQYACSILAAGTKRKRGEEKTARSFWNRQRHFEVKELVPRASRIHY